MEPPPGGRPALRGGGRAAGGLFAGTSEQALAHYRGLAGAGMRYFIVGIDAADHETAELLATAVLPALSPWPA